jgi:hypothetical protein
MNPWKNFDQAVCLPDNCMCEGIRDSLIRQPSATWSSVAYVLAAFAIYRHVKEKTMNLKMWAMVCILMGLTSFFGHMSFVRFSLALDFASIVLVMSFFSIWNLLTRLKQSLGRIFIFFGLFYLTLYGVMFSMTKMGKISVVFIVFTFAIIEIIREMGPGFLKARTLQYSLGVFAFSFGLFVMDEMHVNCSPLGLFQLHSLWHIGTSVAMFLFGKWRFDELSVRKVPDAAVVIEPV